MNKSCQPHQCRSIDVARVDRFRDALLLEARGGRKTSGETLVIRDPMRALIRLHANQEGISRRAQRSNSKREFGAGYINI